MLVNGCADGLFGPTVVGLNALSEIAGRQFQFFGAGIKRPRMRRERGHTTDAFALQWCSASRTGEPVDRGAICQSVQRTVRRGA